MNLKAAIKKAKIRKCKLKNYNLAMYNQTAKSLLYWLLLDPKNVDKSIETLKKMSSSNDWELDRDYTQITADQAKSITAKSSSNLKTVEEVLEQVKMAAKLGFDEWSFRRFIDDKKLIHELKDLGFSFYKDDQFHYITWYRK